MSQALRNRDPRPSQTPLAESPNCPIRSRRRSASSATTCTSTPPTAKAKRPKSLGCASPRRTCPRAPTTDSAPSTPPGRLHGPRRHRLRRYETPRRSPFIAGPRCADLTPRIAARKSCSDRPALTTAGDDRPHALPASLSAYSPHRECGSVVQRLTAGRIAVYTPRRLHQQPRRPVAEIHRQLVAPPGNRNGLGEVDLDCAPRVQVFLQVFGSADGSSAVSRPASSPPACGSAAIGVSVRPPDPRNAVRPRRLPSGTGMPLPGALRGPRRPGGPSRNRRHGPRTAIRTPPRSRSALRRPTHREPTPYFRCAGPSTPLETFLGPCRSAFTLRMPFRQPTRGSGRAAADLRSSPAAAPAF